MAPQHDVAAPASVLREPREGSARGWEVVVLAFVVRFACGGAVVAAIPVIARVFTPAVAGVMVLLPAVTFMGFYFLGEAAGVGAVHQASRGALFALPAMFCFLAAVWLLSRWQHVGLARVMWPALVVWWVIALPIIMLLPRLSRFSLSR